MKLSRLLLLVPAAGLLMTGCDKKSSGPSLSVSGVYKQAYAVNEGFEKTGIVVTATYSDGSTKDVTASAEFSGFSSAAVGSSTVTVSAEGGSTTFSVEIKKGYAFNEAKAIFAEEGFGSVIVPSFFGEAIEVSEYDEDYPGDYLISSYTEAEFAAYRAALVAAGWEAGEKVEYDYMDMGILVFDIYPFSIGERVYCEIAEYSGLSDYGIEDGIEVVFGVKKEQPELVKAINEAFSFLGRDILSYDEDYGDWYGELDLSEEGQEASYVAEAPEDLLKPAVEEVAEHMPESLGAGVYTFYPSSAGFFTSYACTVAEIAYENEEAGYAIYVYAYCMDSALTVSIDCYFAE